MKLNVRNWLLGVTALAAILGFVSYRSISVSKPVTEASHASIVADADKGKAGGIAIPKPTLTPEQRAATLNAYGKLPLSFEENKGQTDARVKYMAHGNGYSLFLTPTEAVLSLRNAGAKINETQQSTLRMKLANANTASAIHGDEILPGKTNYLFGNKPANYTTGISQFKKVRCDNVYAGIDMVYYGNQRQLEYDFVVAPGANPAAIRMSFCGSKKIEVSSEGSLAIHVGNNVVEQHKPVIYQNINGKHQTVAGSYEIVSVGKSDKDETVVGFNVLNYDRTAPLVIDPVLVYATFYGDKPNLKNAPSDHSGDDVGLGIAIDNAGAAYVVGHTSSFEFPLVGNIQNINDGVDHNLGPTQPVKLIPPQITNPGTHAFPETIHGFITKFAADGRSLIYSTYLAGFDGADECRGVVVDSLGNAYVCGATSSTNFPTRNAQHISSGGVDAFLLKINAGGTDLIFSTYLGGSGDDFANDLALDPSTGNIIVVGTTNSSDFVISHAVQPTFGGRGANATGDAFVASFSGDGAINYFSTYLGGADDETGNGVAVDSSGNIYITGSTASLNFPISHPFQVDKGAGVDAFVTKLNASGTVLVFSTYLGGDSDDIGNGIAVDLSGNVYVTGSTASSNFPTISPTILPIQSANGGPAGTTDAFVSKFNITGSALIFSTYLGGTVNDAGKRIRIDSRNAIYVAGTTNLTSGVTADKNGFPVAPKTNTLQPSHSGQNDGFLAKFNPTGTPLVYSTYIGSDHHSFVTDNGDQNTYFLPDGTPATPTKVAVNGLAVDNAGNAYITGSTDGAFYFTFNAYSDIAPLEPIPGEDFPAPHQREYTDPGSGILYPWPAEQTNLISPVVNIDLNDIIISKIQDNSPIITSGMLAQAILNINFSGYNIVATNSPLSYDAAGLPPGMSVSTTTGAIAGTPTQVGIFNVVITATNQSGTGSQILTISVSSIHPVITSPLTATGNVGSVFQFNLTADGNPGSFAVTPVAPTLDLPVGIALDSINGLLSGVPVAEGTYQYNVTASNAFGTSPAKLLSITILPAVPVISSSVNAQAVVGIPFTFSITATGNPQAYGATPSGTQTGNILLLAIGLQLDTSTGVISGTPTTLGFYKFTISATNAGGTGTQSFELTVIPAVIPIISSSSNAIGIFNEPFTFTISASNNPIVFGVQGALPTGLTLNDQTGVISGVPQQTGTFAVTQTAANVAGQGSKPLNIVINIPAIPVVTSPLIANAVVNASFEYDIIGSNHPTSFNAIGLPAGLAINTTTGQITGIPTSAGQFSITIQAINLGGTGSATLVLTVAAQQTPIIVSSNQANGFVGIPFSYQITATANPTTFTATGLPANLVVSASGLITGTPTTAGTFTINLSATNPQGTGTKTLTLTVTTPVAPTFTSPLNVNGIDGSPFSYAITASGIGPINFTAGGLPTGLSLVNSTIVGTTSSGIYSVTLTAFSPATNPASSGGPPNAFGVPPTTATLVINIAASAATIVNSTLNAMGTVGVPFFYTVQVSGSVPLTTFTATPLPSGLTFNPATGQISGTPTTVAVTTGNPFPVTLTAANAANSGNPSVKTLLITINAAAPKFTSPAFAEGTDGVPFRYVIAATGTQTISYTVDTLPPGLALTNGIISGTPNVPRTTIVTITATNLGGSAQMMLVIQIDVAPPVLSIPTTVTGSAGVPFTFTLTATGSPQIVYTVPGLPPGLVVDGDKIDGTPTTAGIYNVIVSAQNDAPTTDSQPLQIVINPAPPTISAATINGMDDFPLTPFQLIFNGALPISFSAVSLPTGVTIDPNTGIISGTPMGAGQTVASVTASNSGGVGTQNIIFNILASKPKITSNLNVQASPGVPFTYTITAIGTPTITYQAFNLPAGLTITGGVISGTPSGPVGTVSVALIASNAQGSDQQTLDINIQQTPPTITNQTLQASGQQFIPFSFTLTSNGSPPITFGAMNLPAGLSINPSTGEISGTPTAIGATNVAITATNLFGSDTGKTLVITIGKSSPKITSPLNVSTGLNEPYTYTITATGSPTIVFGAQNLPPGLNIDQATGIISGTPTQVGSYPVSIVAANTAGSDSKILTINITANPPKITSPLSITAGTIQSLTYTITATGAGPLTYSVGELPPGLTFSGNQITGVPLQQGTYQVTITATNPLGSDTETLTITVLEDSDGDGFPDDLETFLGTNPLDPNSNPFIGGKGSIRVLNVTQMSVKLNFKTQGQDTLTLKGTIQLDPGFVPNNQPAVIYVSGIAAKVTLNAKAKGSSQSLSVKTKAAKGVTPFTVNFGKGDFRTKLANVGMTNANVKLPKTVSTLVIVFVDNILYRSDKVLTYTAHLNKNGTAKQSN